MYGRSTPAADFADCLLTARAAHLGRSRFLTFEADAVRLPGVGWYDRLRYAGPLLVGAGRSLATFGGGLALPTEWTGIRATPGAQSAERSRFAMRRCRRAKPSLGYPANAWAISVATRSIPAPCYFSLSVHTPSQSGGGSWAW